MLSVSQRRCRWPAAAGFSTGDFVYIWGPADNGTWAWVRAELVGVSFEHSNDCSAPGTTGPIRFVRLPTVSLDESVSFQISGTTIKRATASGGAWSAANEIGSNFSSLTFTYYDGSNRIVAPSTVADRKSIARVDVQVVAQTSELPQQWYPAELFDFFAGNSTKSKNSLIC